MCVVEAVVTARPPFTALAQRRRQLRRTLRSGGKASAGVLALRPLESRSRLQGSLLQVVQAPACKAHSQGIVGRHSERFRRGQPGAGSQRLASRTNEKLWPAFAPQRGTAFATASRPRRCHWRRSPRDQPDTHSPADAPGDRQRGEQLGAGFDHVGISTLDSRGTFETVATTDELVVTLDRIQYDLGEGPCYDTLRLPDVDVVIAAPAIRHDQRWPRYVPAAVGTGVLSQLAVKLYVDHQGSLGGLNFYSTTSETIDPEAEAIADLFATHAAIALENARERESLNEALRSRKMIGQAIGIIMERFDMNEDRAFDFLVRTSSTSNIKLRDVAEEVVHNRNAT